MLKEKLGEVQKQLRGASYHTLLAVSAFIDAGANMMDKAFPRCVKTYGGASNRAVPIKVVIEALAAMTEWEVGAMKGLQNSELRCLFLYALGKEEGDELTATCMVIKQFVAECADLYQTLGCRLAGLSLEGKAKAGVNWQGEDSVGYLFIKAGADKVPTYRAQADDGEHQGHGQEQHRAAPRHEDDEHHDRLELVAAQGGAARPRWASLEASDPGHFGHVHRQPRRGLGNREGQGGHHEDEGELCRSRCCCSSLRGHRGREARALAPPGRGRRRGGPPSCCMTGGCMTGGAAA